MQQYGCFLHVHVDVHVRDVECWSGAVRSRLERHEVVQLTEFVQREGELDRFSFREQTAGLVMLLIK